jgi:hypothetical protein
MQQPTSAEAQAAPGAPEVGFEMEVTRAGASADGHIHIQMRATSGAFERVYLAPQALRKEMLAIALTAIATHYRVAAYLPTGAEWETLNRLLLIR